MARRAPRPWLTALYEDKGLTIEGFAATLGVSSACIRHWETGIRSPSPDIAIKVGETLGLSETESLVRFFGKSA